MALSKDEEARLSYLEGIVKRTKSNIEYYKQKDYIVDGKHCGWITYIPGDDGEEDWAIVIGDEEKDLLEVDPDSPVPTLVPKNKKALKTIIDNIKHDRGFEDNGEPEPVAVVKSLNDSLSQTVPIIPIERPEPVESNEMRVKRIRNQIYIDFDQGNPDKAESLF